MQMQLSAFVTVSCRFSSAFVVANRTESAGKCCVLQSAVKSAIAALHRAQKAACQRRRRDVHDCTIEMSTGYLINFVLISCFLLFLDHEPIPHLVLVGATVFKKSLRLRRLKSEGGKIWQDCSSNKYASIDGVEFLTRCRSFKMAAMTSFHTEKCCHLMGAQVTLARCPLPPSAAFTAAEGGCPLAILHTVPLWLSCLDTTPSEVIHRRHLLVGYRPGSV